MWEPWPKVEARHLARYVTPDAVRVCHLVAGRDDLLRESDGRRLLIRRLYEALTAHNISYAPEKYDPHEERQQIRTPAEILEAPGEGTCLDLSVLFCGLCLGFDLLPLLIVIEGHALVAVSLERGLREWLDFGRREIEHFDRGLLEDPEPLRRLIDQQSYLTLECTGFAHSERLHGSEPEKQDRSNGLLTFEQAALAGRKQLQIAARPFRFALDIASLHYHWGLPPFPQVELKELTQRLTQIAQKYTILAAPEAAVFKPARLKERLNRLLERHALFGGRDRELCSLDAFVTNRPSGYAFVTAKSGFGKTALLANWIRELEERKEKVAYHLISRLDDLAGEDIALRSLCQQLVALHGLTGELPASVTELRSLYPQLLGVSPRDGRRIIVVLDGLDEVEGWKVGADLFPSSLPAGVFLVFSARDTGRDWLTDLELKPDQVFLEALETLGTGEIAHLLRAAGDVAAEHAADSIFVKAVFDCSSGDPFFLRYLVEDIRDKPILTVTELQAQPRGLVKYLDGWWKQVSDVVGEQAVRDLLGYLLVARGRMGRDDLTDISAEDKLDGFVFENTLEKLRRFVIGNDVDGYALCHPRFQDYLATNRIKASDQKPYRDRLLRYCAAWEQHRSRYALNHFAAHLREAGQNERLFELLSDKNWYLAKIESDSTGTAFLADLAEGSSAAEVVNSQAIQNGQPAPLLGREIRIALLVASLHGLSEHIPFELLTALVKHDLWSIEQALAVARRNPDPGDRADCLRMLSGLNKAESPLILREALLSAQAMDPSEWQRLDVLRRLLPALPETMVDLSREAANKIEDPQQQADELAALVPFLPPAHQAKVAQTAFRLLAKSEWDTTRVAVWESMVEGWPEPLKSEAVARALEEIRAMPEGEEWRARSLTSIAEKVSGPSRDDLLQEALEATLAIKEDEPKEIRPGSMQWSQSKTLAFDDLVPQLSGPLLQQALLAAQNIKAPKDRSAVLCKFVPRLAREGKITESLRVVEAVADHDRVRALAEMAPSLTGTTDIEAALRMVPNQKGAPHGWPLAALSIRLAELGNSQMALDRARAIGSPIHRLDALAGIAAKMSVSPSRELIKEILDAASLPTVQRNLAARRLADRLEALEECLLALALRLAKEGRFDEALATASAFPDTGIHGGSGPRVEALTLLAGHLPEPTKRQTLRDALAAARLVADGRTRVMTIAQLFQQIPSHVSKDIQPVLEAALSVVPLIKEEDEQAEALGRLAMFLTPSLLEQALTLARSFDRSENRILAMIRLASRLFAPQKDQVLQEAMDLAETVKWHRRNAHAFIEMVAQLPEPRQRETLTWAVTNNLMWLLIALTPRLPEPLQREAIAGLQAIEDTNERVRALSRVAQQLPEELLRETLDAIQNLQEDSDRPRSLIDLAHCLPDSALEQAVNLAQQLTDDYEWAEALATLLPRWAESGHPLEAFEVLEQMDWSQANLVGHQRSRRAQILAAILPKLSDNEREAALQDALRNIRNLQSQSKYMFACAAVDLVQHLPEPMRTQLIAEAFRATVDNQSWEERADALQALAPHLPIALLADATTAASQLPDSPYLNQSPRAYAIAALATRLATLAPFSLYPIWRATLSQLSRSPRSQLLWDLPALCPVMTTLGCANAPIEMAQAITEVAQRWP